MSQTSTSLLKQLQSQKAKIEADKEALRIQQSNLNRESSLKDEELAQLDMRITQCTTGTLTVSEHAILRYAERVMGLDVNQIISQILTPDVRGLHARLGSGEYPLSDKFSLRIKNNVVVTVFQRTT